MPVSPKKFMKIYWNIHDPMLCFIKCLLIHYIIKPIEEFEMGLRHLKGQLTIKNHKKSPVVQSLQKNAKFNNQKL